MHGTHANVSLLQSTAQKRPIPCQRSPAFAAEFLANKGGEIRGKKNIQTKEPCILSKEPCADCGIPCVPYPFQCDMTQLFVPIFQYKPYT